MKTSETVYLNSLSAVVNGFAPFTLTIIPSSIPLTNKVYKIVYNYGDGSVENQILKPDSPEENPSFVTKTHNYILTSSFVKDFQITADFYQFNKTSFERYNFVLSLSSPSLESLNPDDFADSSYYFKELHLIGSRMFGPENELLYMFEGIDPDCFVPLLVNWKSKPVQTIIRSIKDNYYRPYRLLSPFENERVNSINTGTEIIEVPAGDGGPNEDIPEEFLTYDAPLQNEVIEYFDRVGYDNITNENKVRLNSFIYQLKAINLWNSMICWTLRSGQNKGSGTTIYSLGGLGIYDGTFQNNATPSWGSDGITIASSNERITTSFNFSDIRPSIISVFKPSSSTSGAGDRFMSNDESGTNKGIGFDDLASSSFRLLGNYFAPGIGTRTANTITAFGMGLGTSNTFWFQDGTRNSLTSTVYLPSVNYLAPVGAGNLSSGTPLGVYSFSVAFDGVTMSSALISYFYSLYKSTLGRGLGLP